MLEYFYSHKIIRNISSSIGVIIIIASLFIYRGFIRPISFIGYILVCLPLVFESIIDYQEKNKISTMIISTALISSMLTLILISLFFQLTM